MTDEPQGSAEQDQPQGEIETPEVAVAMPQGTDWQREARKWESRAKKDAQTLSELREQLGQMVSPDKVAAKDEAIAQAQAEVDAANLKAMKYRIALAEGLPPDLAERLLGDNEDEIREDAERLKVIVRSNGSKDAAKKGQMAQQPDAKPNTNELLRLLAKG